MKFSEFSESRWLELKPYMDTCLLPITGLTGTELPHEATAELEKLRDLMDRIEIPFKGRIVTYPASHYADTDNADLAAERLCRSLKQAGFRFVIMVTASRFLKLSAPSSDLIVAPRDDGEWPDAADIAADVRRLWAGEPPIEAI